MLLEKFHGPGQPPVGGTERLLGGPSALDGVIWFRPKHSSSPQPPGKAPLAEVPGCCTVAPQLVPG